MIDYRLSNDLSQLRQGNMHLCQTAAQNAQVTIKHQWHAGGGLSLRTANL